MSKPPSRLIRYFDDFVRRDYTRTKTLQLIMNEKSDHNLAGDIAELSVHSGDFAQLMNIGLSNKNLFLFDTFTGFDSSGFKTDHEMMLYEKVKDEFKNTSVDLVLDNMKFLEKCIIRKGIFPGHRRESSMQSFVS